MQTPKELPEFNAAARALSFAMHEGRLSFEDLAMALRTLNSIEADICKIAEKQYSEALTVTIRPDEKGYLDQRLISKTITKLNGLKNSQQKTTEPERL